MMQLRTQTSSAAARGARGVVPAARVAAGARALRVVPRATQEVDTITGVVFEPFQAVKAEMELVSNTKAEQSSFARVNFHPECEAALNEQINIEYNVSYIYHALYAYFDRDNVALPGMAAYFKAGSEEEREHAEVLMQYQNQRGGRVKLKSILMPEMEFNHPEKGDALYAMELALSLEKLNFQKLRALHAVASKHEDASMSDFVEGQLLGEQVEAVKKVSEYVAQLRRVGKGLGVYQFDQALLEEVGKA